MTAQPHRTSPAQDEAQPVPPPVTVHLTAAVLRACAAIVETHHNPPTCYTLANKLWAAAEEIDQQTPKTPDDDDNPDDGRPLR